MKRILLIDSDVFLYQAAAATETEVDWGDDLWTLHGYLDEAIATFDDKIDGIQETLKGDQIILAMTASNNWRKQVLPTYKGNRKDKRKPLVFRPLRDYAAQKYETFERPTLEADDVMGILATRKSAEPVERIIVTIDKDLKTIPGLHFNTNKPDDGVFVVGEADADRFHLTQALTGDVTDGYAGCPGIGPKTAEKLFEKHGMSWETVVMAYEKAGLNETVALQMARVARICRASDYDFKNKEVILWTPK
jgi:DNA polymerase I